MKRFEADKNAQELGIDTKRKFIVVKKNKYYNVWDILELERDDWSSSPYFALNWKIYHIPWEHLYYADNIVVVDWQVYQKVYVSNVSVEHALEEKQERILLHTYPWVIEQKYSTVDDRTIENFIAWRDYDVFPWKYIAEIPLSPLSSVTKKVTVCIDWEQKEIEITEETLKEVYNLMIESLDLQFNQGSFL